LLVDIDYVSVRGWVRRTQRDRGRGWSSSQAHGLVHLLSVPTQGRSPHTAYAQSAGSYPRYPYAPHL